MANRPCVGNPVLLSQLDSSSQSDGRWKSWESRSSLPTRLDERDLVDAAALGIPFFSPN